MVNLKDMREQRGLTQQAVAEVIGVSQQHYSMVELGRRGVSVKVAVALGKFFGFDWTAMFECETVEEMDNDSGDRPGSDSANPSPQD